jgi:PadR family transcriptional regulator AphA
MSATLRHALLALVAEKPRSGYDLTRIFEQTLSHAWSARHSQIYPELAQLRADGLIEATGRGPRNRVVYAATDEGRAVVRRWLVDSPPSHVSRNETILRVFFLWLVEREERREFLLRERSHHQRVLGGYERLAAKEVWVSAPAEAGRIALEFGLRYERAMLDWIEWALDQPLIEPKSGRERRS